MRVMITGGGTGGHTSPAVAIIEELQKRDPRLIVQWVGRKGAIEERVSDRLGIAFRHVPVSGWPRGRNLRKVSAVMRLALGVARSYFYVKRFGPHIVIGVGGYVSLPLCYVAEKMGIPTILHEQNKRLGMANQFLARRADRLLLSFPDTVGEFPAEIARVVGNPVRAGFMKPPGQAAAREQFHLDAHTRTVLVSGGSQGAHSINAAIADALALFGPGECQFLWMTGPADFQKARNAAAQARVRVEPMVFIDDMPAAFAAADLVVSRSGASSTAEIAVMGKASILIPYPHATDNHQESNARAMEQAGAAVVLLDAECGGHTLGNLIRQCLQDEARLTAMSKAAGTLARPGAAEAIVEEVLMLVFSEE